MDQRRRKSMLRHWEQKSASHSDQSFKLSADFPHFRLKIKESLGGGSVTVPIPVGAPQKWPNKMQKLPRNLDNTHIGFQS